MIIHPLELRRGHWRKILFMTAFWTAAAVFIITYEAVLTDFEATSGGDTYSFLSILLFTLTVAVPAAFVLSVFEISVVSRVFRRKPFGMVLALKTGIYICGIFVSNSIVLLLVYSSELGTGVMQAATWNQYVTDSIYSGMMLLRMLYWGSCVFLALFFIQVSQKFGDGVLLKFITGKYHHPREEHRVFMFMDLKSSTSYAEKLGHMEYSRLIQDCFFDLTDIATKYRAMIYQYVGDEVVLTWETEDGMQDGNCVRAFYAYDAALRSRREYYLDRYGLVPEFKAALNGGSVTVAEVGEVKKELAYHGDVVNTAARIQEKCNEFGCRLLISDSIREELIPLQRYSMSLVGDIVLKGKKRSVRIYSVQQAAV